MFASLGTAILSLGLGWHLRRGVLGMFASLGTAVLSAESEVWVWQVPES